MNIESEIVDLKRRSDVSEHRIEDLESEMKDNREVLQAIGAMNQSLEDVKVNFTSFKGDMKAEMQDMRCDIKRINIKPALIADKVKAAVITAAAVGIVSALLALIFKQ